VTLFDRGHWTGEDRLSRGVNNQIYRAIGLVYERVQPLPNLRLVSHNEVPLTRGLGSSSTAIVGGLLAANTLCGEPLSPPQLLGIAASIEGYPDNAAACLFGGCQIVLPSEGEGYLTASVPLPPTLQVVLLIPDFQIPTARARAVLAQQVSRRDAVFNLGRVALLVRSFATGDLSLLREAMEDRLHQPARRPLFPAMDAIFSAAIEAGALGACLSGSGPTVLAFARDDAPQVAEAMKQAAQASGLGASVRLARPASRVSYRRCFLK
jgi:homoserine kinase